MRNNDVETGDLIKMARKKTPQDRVGREEYGLVVRTNPGITSTSWCQPTILWEDGIIATHVSSIEMEVVGRG